MRLLTVNNQDNPWRPFSLFHCPSSCGRRSMPKRSASAVRGVLLCPKQFARTWPVASGRRLRRAGMRPCARHWRCRRRSVSGKPRSCGRSLRGRTSLVSRGPRRSIRSRSTNSGAAADAITSPEGVRLAQCRARAVRGRGRIRAGAVRLSALYEGRRHPDRLTLDNATRTLKALEGLTWGISRELDPADVIAKPLTIVGDDPRVDILTLACSIA